MKFYCQSHNYPVFQILLIPAPSWDWHFSISIYHRTWGVHAR
jgi:hypothetical protein